MTARIKASNFDMAAGFRSRRQTAHHVEVDDGAGASASWRRRRAVDIEDVAVESAGHALCLVIKVSNGSTTLRDENKTTINKPPQMPFDIAI